MKAKINFELDQEFKEKIELAASLLHISVAGLIRMLLSRELDRIIDELGGEDE